MFIRKTTTRSKGDGSIYQTYRLVDQWKEINLQIESILHHQPSLLSIGPEIEPEAKRLADKIIANNKEYAPKESVSRGYYKHVDIDSLEHSKVRSVVCST